MKPTYTRRYRPRTAVHCEGRKGCHENFFGDPEQDRFFQPSIYSTQEPTIHRKCEHCEQEEKQTVQRKGEGGGVSASDGAGASAGMNAVAVGQYIQSLPGKGTPLPAPTRQFFEARMGHDLGGVRIHTGEEAARSAKAVHAKAYTTGRQIVFNEGQYDISSGEGKKLLAHELAHVVQQDERVQRQPKASDKKEEKEKKPPTKEDKPLEANKPKETDKPVEANKPKEEDKPLEAAKPPEKGKPEDKSKQKVKDPFLKEKNITTEKTIGPDEGDMRKILVGGLGYSGSVLNKYIAPKMSDFEKNVKLRIVSDSEFGDAYLPYAKKRHGEEGADPSIPAEKRVPDVRGFYDPDSRTVYVRLRVSYCQLFHETIHSFSDPDFLREHVGRSAMEGLTQYFTNIVFTEQLGPGNVCKSNPEYTKYLGCAQKFIDAFGVGPMAELFFNNNIAVIAEMVRRFGLNDEKTFLAVARTDALCKMIDQLKP